MIELWLWSAECAVNNAHNRFCCVDALVGRKCRNVWIHLKWFQVRKGWVRIETQAGYNPFEVTPVEYNPFEVTP